MTASELIRLLQKYPANTEVQVIDPEGNDYYPVSGGAYHEPLVAIRGGTLRLYADEID